MVEDIPLKAGSLEAEKVANLQNELQKLNDAAHQEQLQRGTAAEAGLVSRAAELQDELSSLGDAAAEEGYGGSAQIDLLRTEGHDSTEGEMSLIDEAAQRVAGRAAEQQAGANGRAKKGARQAAKAKGGAKKMKKSTAIQQAAAQAAANAQKASRKQKDAQARSNLVEDADTDDYDEW